MSSLDKSTCDKFFGDSGGKEGASISTSNKKECTSCEQKNDNCNDGASNTTSICDLSDIGTVAEDISKVNISNDDNDTGSSSTTNSVKGVVESMAIYDEKLFADPPPKEDCPICMLPMPFATGVCGVRLTYMSCCGKYICEGCVFASAEEIARGKLKEWCDLCRVPLPKSDKQDVKRLKQRTNLNDAEAFLRLGNGHFTGQMVIKSGKKAFELWTKAAELGSVNGYYALATTTGRV